MDYTIHPYEGIGPIRFGMTPQQIHEILGEPEDKLQAGVACDLPADRYTQLGFYVFYKNPGTCEAVSLFDRTNPIFQEMTLMGRPMKDLKGWLKSLGSDIQYFDLGFISFKFGISISTQDYRPDLNCNAGSVIVFERGFYDQVADIHAKYPREEASA